MGKFIDLTGKKFGRWTVLKRAENKGNYIRWKCLCDCGAIRIVNGNSLKRGISKSCGCISSEITAERNRKHGMSKTPEYRVWTHMTQRCTNKTDGSYKNYGARGIKVCDRWLHSFENFYADMGKRPTEKHSIERKNNNGDYEPDNCKWATKKEQCNNRRSSHMLTLNGETKTMSQWSDITGISIGTLWARIEGLGWSVEKALTVPLEKKQTITYKGITKTISQWAKVIGVKPRTLQSRINDHGWSVEKALFTTAGTDKYLIYNGIKKTLTEWAEDSGIKKATLYARLARGWSLERALTTHAKRI